MLFSTMSFLFVFLPSILFIYYILLSKSRKLQNIFLTIASLFFYAWGEPVFVLIMILSIFINYIFAIIVDKYRNDKIKIKISMFLMLLANLGILFVFKYLVFSITNINSIFELSITVPNLMLPIGISFFTFQAISYVIDVYREKGKLQKNILNVALYISFFPQLIAGPIVRYQTISDQINNRKESINLFSEGIVLFIIGLAKKVIIANNMAIVADLCFTGEANTLLVAWIGALAYTFQIFFDFSGYSDMARGLGKMFGFNFLENFNYPYISKSVSEFWRRWHISLGTWFKDYVYIPLGGSKVSTKKRLIFNLFIVWFLTGIWHGANWTFICWGLLYFILLTLEKITPINKKIGIFGYIYTLFFVIIGWVLFRSTSLSDASLYLSNMFGFNTSLVASAEVIRNILDNVIPFILAIIFSLPIGKILTNKFNNKIGNIIYLLFIILIFIISLSYIVKGSYNPFIYFNF